MSKNFKDFYNFIKCINPSLCHIWEDFNTREDPKPGDKYLIFSSVGNSSTKNNYSNICKFDKILLDSSFDNGVAFNYIFKDENNNDVNVYSINSVNDENKLTKEQRKYIFGFWRNCIKIL